MLANKCYKIVKRCYLSRTYTFLHYFRSTNPENQAFDDTYYWVHVHITKYIFFNLKTTSLLVIVYTSKMQLSKTCWALVSCVLSLENIFLCSETTSKKQVNMYLTPHAIRGYISTTMDQRSTYNTREWTIQLLTQ